MASSQRQQPAQRRLTKLLEQNVITEGMYVRSHGDHLIVGRVEQFEPDRQPEDRDRIRLTDLGRAGYGLRNRHQINYTAHIGFAPIKQVPKETKPLLNFLTDT